MFGFIKWLITVFAVISVLAIIGEGVKELFGIKSRGSETINWQRVDEMAKREACDDLAKKTGEVPLECRR